MFTENDCPNANYIMDNGLYLPNNIHNVISSNYLLDLFFRNGLSPHSILQSDFWKEDDLVLQFITNENSYGNYRYNPSIHYLSITRYWNIINYFCPNRNIIPENWTQVFKNNIYD